MASLTKSSVLRNILLIAMILLIVFVFGNYFHRYNQSNNKSTFTNTQSEKNSILLSDINSDDVNIPFFNPNSVKEKEQNILEADQERILNINENWKSCDYPNFGFKIKISENSSCRVINDYQISNPDENFVGSVDLFLNNESDYGRGVIIVSSYKRLAKQSSIEWLKSRYTSENHKYLYISNFAGNDLKGIRVEMDPVWWQGGGPHEFIVFESPRYFIMVSNSTNYTNFETVISTLKLE